VEDSRVFGDDANEVGGGGAFGEEEGEFGEDGFAGVVGEEVRVCLDDAADLGVGEAMGFEEGED